MRADIQRVAEALCEAHQPYLGSSPDSSLYNFLARAAIEALREDDMSRAPDVQWRVTPSPDGTMHTMTNESDTVLTLIGPAEQMQVSVFVNGTRSLYEWNLIWQRMGTLIEVARTDQRIQSGVEVLDYTVSPDDTLCHGCQQPPPHYVSWGMACESTPGCRGTYYPRSFVEERFREAPKDTMTKMSFRVPQKTWEATHEQAAAAGLSYSDFVRRALEDYLKRHKS